MATTGSNNSGGFRPFLWRMRYKAAQSFAPNGFIVEKQQGNTTRPALPGSDAEAVKAHAAELWKKGKRLDSIEYLRAEAIRTNNADIWWALYHRLQANGNFDVASLALRSTLQLNPSNMGALEMLIEDAEVRGPNGSVPQAFARLAEVLPSRPDKHRLALTLALPTKNEPILNVLRTSSDPWIRDVLNYAENTTADQMKELLNGGNALPIAIAAMGMGRNSIAVEALGMLPDDQLPVDHIRITVRRLLRTKKTKAAHNLLRELRRVLPEDKWVSRKYRATSGEAKIMSNYQLGRKGFPFKKKAPTPKFERDPKTSLYLLHNSLPYHSAGYATRTHGLLTAIRDEGWNVQGVTRLGYPYDMPKFEELGDIPAMDMVDGVPYHRLSTEYVLEMKKPIQEYVSRYSKRLMQLAHEQRPFVIHAASNHWNGLAAVETANRLGIDSIYEVRGLWEVTRGSRDPEWMGGGMYTYMARMEADAAKYATKVLAITHALKDELINRGVDGDKITVVPNAVNADRFVPQPRNEELAARLGLTGKTVIGYIGSVLDYEGLGLLIDAAQALAAEGRDFAVLIVGDGAELESFQARVAEIGLEEKIIFTGRVPHEEVEDYYSLVDIAPFPRLPLPVCEMVSPLKPFEAMAMEKAVVSSNVAALEEIVQDGYNGLLHEKGDAMDLKAKLAELIDNPDLRLQLAKNGREWVLRERQWQQVAKSVCGVYQQISESMHSA